MTDEWPATCADVEALLGKPLRHCISCHEDWEEFSYDMVWVDLPDGREAHVCCGVKRAALSLAESAILA